MKTERGVCFGCGKITEGIPARPDWIISGARALRSALSLPEKHTVACSADLPSLVEKRKKFAKNLRWCEAGAAAFFILALAAAAYTQSIGVQEAIGALLGSLFILVLSVFYYCPAFESAK